MKDKKVKYFIFGFIALTIIILFLLFLSQGTTYKEKKLEEFKQEQIKENNAKIDKIQELKKEKEKIQDTVEDTVIGEKEEQSIANMENSQVINHAPVPPYLMFGSEEMILYYLTEITDFGANDKYQKEVNTSSFFVVDNVDRGGEVERVPLYFTGKEAYIIWQGKVFVYTEAKDQTMQLVDEYYMKIKQLNKDFIEAQKKMTAQLPIEPTKEWLDKIE